MILTRFSSIQRSQWKDQRVRQDRLWPLGEVFSEFLEKMFWFMWRLLDPSWPYHIGKGISWRFWWQEGNGDKSKACHQHISFLIWYWQYPFMFILSLAYVLPFLKICDEICARFGDGFMQKHAVKKGAILLFVGTIGFILECISAMEYFQGIRLSLISSETAITTMLFLLCICKCKWMQHACESINFHDFSGIDIFQLADISPEMGRNIWRIRNNLSIESGTKISRFFECGLIHVKCPRTRCNLSIFENFLSISLQTGHIEVIFWPLKNCSVNWGAW